VETSLVAEPDLPYACDLPSFTPSQHHEVRWLDIDDDFELLRVFHEGRDPAGKAAYTWADAVRWRDSGFTDAGVVEDGVVVARAACWTYSDDAWELAGVFTLPSRRGFGLSRSVCTFVTDAILQAGKTATCHTGPGNLAMRRVAESLGYRLVISSRPSVATARR
jgi:predicted GNAT family acetyltransferase